MAPNESPAPAFSPEAMQTQLEPLSESAAGRDSMTAVVAMTPGGVIGKDGEMPWRLRSDLRRFKSVTMGGTLVMGRKTFESIGRPLPGRQTIVLTRDSQWRRDGVTPAGSPGEAIRQATGRIFVVGGAEIYRLFWASCREVQLTWVLAEVAGDTQFEADLSGFRLVQQMRIPAGASDQYPTEFCSYARTLK